MDRAVDLQDDTLAEMLALVDAEWTVTDSRIAEPGHNAVAHVTVQTHVGERDLVVKVSTGADAGVDDIGLRTEAALLSIVGAHTDVRVPAVHAVVESEAEVPTPFVVMDAVPGTQIRKRDAGRLTDDAVARLARESGRMLAEVHQIPAPDGFGRIVVHDDRTSGAGARPAADPGQLTITRITDEPPSDEWPAILDDWVEQELTGHADSRFDDLTPHLRTELETRTDQIQGAFESVIARIDHGLHNLACNPETGELTGVFDWGFTLATPPAYDIACVLANLTRDPWAVHPATPARDDLVRQAFLDGYEAHGDASVIEQYHANRDCYDLLCLTRAMVHLEMAMPNGSRDDHDEAARQYRELVAESL